MTHQPDFSSARRPVRGPFWETLFVAAAALVLGGAALEAARARSEARTAETRLEEVRRQVEAARTRQRALETRARSMARVLPAAEAPPAQIVADIASVVPADTRLDLLSIDYSRDGLVEMQVVARDAAAWDSLLDRLGQAPRFREVEPGPEARDGEVRSLVRARWAGDAP